MCAYIAGCDVHVQVLSIYVQTVFEEKFSEAFQLRINLITCKLSPMRFNREQKIRGKTSPRGCRRIGWSNSAACKVQNVSNVGADRPNVNIFPSCETKFPAIKIKTKKKVNLLTNVICLRGYEKKIYSPYKTGDSQESRHQALFVWVCVDSPTFTPTRFAKSTNTFSRKVERAQDFPHDLAAAGGNHSMSRRSQSAHVEGLKPQ